VSIPTSDSDKFDRISQELQELKSRFSNANITLIDLDGVLVDLENIKNEFEKIVDLYLQLQKHVSSFSKENEIFKQIQQSLDELRDDSESRFKEIHFKISDRQNVEVEITTLIQQLQTDTRISLSESSDNSELKFNEIHLKISEIQTILNSGELKTQDILSKTVEINKSIFSITGKLDRLDLEVNNLNNYRLQIMESMHHLNKTINDNYRKLKQQNLILLFGIISLALVVSIVTIRSFWK
jgi:chromosome segregation ATPase